MVALGPSVVAVSAESLHSLAPSTLYCRWTVFCAVPGFAMVTAATALVCVMLPMLTPDTLGSSDKVLNVAVFEPAKALLSEASTSYIILGLKPVRSMAALPSLVTFVWTAPHSVSPETR